MLLNSDNNFHNNLLSEKELLLEQFDSESDTEIQISNNNNKIINDNFNKKSYVEQVSNISQKIKDRSKKM